MVFSTSGTVLLAFRRLEHSRGNVEGGAYATADPQDPALAYAAFAATENLIALGPCLAQVAGTWDDEDRAVLGGSRSWQSALGAVNVATFARVLRPLLVVSIALAVAAGEATADDTGDAPRPPAPATAGTDARKLSPRADAVMAAYAAMYDGALTTQDLRAKAGAPLVRRDGFGLGLLLGYGLTHWGFAAGGGGGDDNLALHRFEATLGGGGALAPGRSLRISLGTAHASDLRDATWSASALQLTSSAMLHWVLGPDDAIVLGAVYTSTAEFLPVLPILGYVHQRDGSRLRIDVFLPRHVRAEYQLHPRLRGALGAEALGNTWTAQWMQSQRTVKRAGGTAFGELGVLLSPRVRLEVRLGLSLMRHTLPAELADAMREQALRPSGFAQLALLFVP